MPKHEALNHFNEVSQEYPGSVTAQSARLAQRFRGNDSLVKLFQQLQFDPEVIATVKKTAEFRHRQMIPTSAPLDVPLLKVKNVLQSEAALVPRMLKLDNTDLQGILKLWKTFDDEDEYRLYVEAEFLKYRWVVEK